MRVVPLREADDEAAFGGKAVQLGKAMRGRLPVPPGVALSVDLVDAIVTGDGFARHVVEPLVSTLGTSLAVRSSSRIGVLIGGGASINFPSMTRQNACRKAKPSTKLATPSARPFSVRWWRMCRSAPSYRED